MQSIYGFESVPETSKFSEGLESLLGVLKQLGGLIQCLSPNGSGDN